MGTALEWTTDSEIYHDVGKQSHVHVKGSYVFVDIPENKTCSTP